ncbi:cytochrome P450 2J2-like [Osmerus eperlanus]|uniref:cytochrome P450 2J2-like n=1 Tax=Osmerus eperlanus TaxID=29151 RepID=UPI002E12BC3B
MSAPTVKEITSALNKELQMQHDISLVFGKLFDYDDIDFQNLLQLSQESILLAGTPLAQMYDIFPWLFKCLPGPHNIIFSNYARLIFFLRKEIEKHNRDWDPFNHRDFVDTYIAEIDKTLDLFEAGTETVTNTLLFALLYMMKYSEKVQDEIEREIGLSRQPCLTDKINMPYTEAVIHETLRVANLVPLNLNRMASKDTTLGGYFIPQGTVLIANLSSVLHDKTEWEKPDMFYPQHFLNEHGHFCKRQAFFPGSAGKRMCLGEQLAHMELFLFFFL